MAKLLDLKAAVDVQVPAAASGAVKIPEPKQGGPKLEARGYFTETAINLNQRIYLKS